MTTVAAVSVRCACGASFDLSPRREYEHRRAGTRPRCSECKSKRPPVRVTPALRDWWLDRFTLEEIRELADALDA